MIAFFRKLGWLGRRRSKEDQLAAELRFHLEEEAEEREAAGLAAADALHTAQRDLGNLGLVLEDTRATWSWTPLEQLLQDLRYAGRAMLRSPAFTTLAALSLALGIGANIAIYSFMDALLLRSLPVADAGSLVVLKWHFIGKDDSSGTVVHAASGYFDDDPKTGHTAAIFPFPAFERLRQTNSALSVLFAYRPTDKLNLIVNGQAEVTRGEYVSGEYFSGLGIVPAAGRLIAPADDRAGVPPAVVLSYGFAQTRFGDAGAAIGHTATINNHPFTVIGVAPRQFFGVDPSRSPTVYLPFHTDLLLDPSTRRSGDFHDEHYYWTEMMGRLRPGVSIAQAQIALASVFEPWVAATATNVGERKYLPHFLLQSGAGGLDKLRRSYSGPLYLLLALVGLILALACANIANLLLARATARRREMAVRLSIGASRGRVIRQFLTESLLLAALGGAAGILVAAWGIRLLTAALSSGSDPFPLHPNLNFPVLAAALLLTSMTGLLFGLAPALRASRVDPMPVLKESRTGARPRAWFGFSLSGTLVVSQMAICLLLLVGAGLFVRTLSNLHSLDVGFDRGNLLLFKINARQAGHPSEELLSFYRDLEQRLAAIPGVRGATIANSPLIGDGAFGWPVIPLGKPKPEHAPTGHGSGFARTATRVLAVAPGFFSTMRIPLVAGREFDGRDSLGTAPVVIVNEAWAKVNLPGENPIGRTVVSAGEGRFATPRPMEIVGLAKNARYDDLTGDFPAIAYLPLEQNPEAPIDEMTFFLRTAGNPQAYATAVRTVVRQADARIPIAGLMTQTAQIEGEIVPETLFARLCTAFALLSLAIACVGLYGTTAYTVARRTGEIGIRMALGAQRQSVIYMVLRDVLILAALGLAISLPVAFGASNLVASLLYGVKPGDPQTIILAAAILFATTLAAAWLPARQASRIEPMSAVRHE